MTKNLEEHGLFSSVQQRTNHKDFQNCLFACFLSQEEPKKVIHALKDPSWIEAMQDELLQFKLQKVWTLVDLPNGKRPIGTKWVYRNKKDERGIVIKNKARLVAQGYTQEEGINYDEVFAPVARIEAIRLFLAYASFKDFVVYQMDVKSAFLYGKIEKEVYVCQPPRFEDPDFPDRVYKVEKALYGLHQAPRAWYETLSTYLLDNGFQRGKIDKTLFIKRDKGLQVKQKEDVMFISQDKYMTEILKKFCFTDIKTASTPMETQKPLLKDEDGEEVDVHLYRLMIGSLMYLTSSRPNIMFAMCACARYQVKMVNGEQLQALVDEKKIVVTEASVKRDLQLDDEEGTYCLPNATIFEELTRMGAKTTTWNEFSSTMASAIICLARNRKFNFSKYIFESMVKNLDNAEEMGEGLANLTDPYHIPIITQPSSSQPQNKHKSRRPKEKDTQVPQSSVPSDPTNVADEDRGCIQTEEIDDSDKDAEITLVDETQGRHDDDIIFDVSDVAGEEVFVAEQGVLDSKKDDVVQVNTAITTVSTAGTIPISVATITEDEITLAQALEELKSVKPKVTTATTATTKGILLQEPSESITTITTIPSKDKGKGIMVEEPLKMKKKDQISFDKQEAIRLQAEFDDEINVDYQLAQRLQAQEQEELTIEEKAKLFQQLLEKRRKHFVAKRAEEKRIRPPTKAQQRSIISKRAGEDLQKESTKKLKIDDVKETAKVDEDKETTELQSVMKVILDEEEVAVDAIPLATKPPSIVDFKILKEGKTSYFQIIRADGSSKRYSAFIHMLRSFNTEDLETLWKLVKAKNGYTRPEEDYERVL
ncbi:putative ribonuclease H-like domain-containing protein [Tanacetum coccineum]